LNKDSAAFCGMVLSQFEIAQILTTPSARNEGGSQYFFERAATPPFAGLHGF